MAAPVTLTHCHTCGGTLSGGRDTFGDFDWPLCLECWLYWQGVKMEPWESPATLTPPGGLYSWQRGYAQPICGSEVDIPHEVAECPECGSVLYVEVTEWEVETGVPTAAGMDTHCRADEEATWGPDDKSLRHNPPNVRSVEEHDYYQCDWERTRARCEAYVKRVSGEKRQAEVRAMLEIRQGGAPVAPLLEVAA